MWYICIIVVPVGLLNGMTRAAAHHQQVEQHIVETLTQDQNRTMLQLFDRALTLAAYPEFCDVFLLVRVRYQNTDIYHYLESGLCIGYLLNQGASDIPKPVGCFRVFTPEDIVKLNLEKQKICMYNHRTNQLLYKLTSDFFLWKI